MARLAVTLWILQTLTYQALGRGTLEIRFVKYQNPGGKIATGSSCDTFNACDHKFTVCLDMLSGPSRDGTTEKDCRLGHVQTGAAKNNDNPTFGSKIGDTDNPLRFEFVDPIPSPMEIRVNVIDSDKTSSDDPVELLRTRLQPPSASYVETSRPFNVTLKGRTTLSLQASVRCAMNYYGINCGVVCMPPSSGQHYTCDPLTGEKHCHAGWSGKLCTEQAHRCESDYCLYGGTCTMYRGQRTCSCPGSLTGLRCEQHLCDQRCAGGTCYWWDTGSRDYICVCDAGFIWHERSTGQTCERPSRG